MCHNYGGAAQRSSGDSEASGSRVNTEGVLMPLQIYGEGKTGEIFIEDERSDGTVVLLVCTEAGTRTSTNRKQRQEETDGASVGVTASSTADGSVYPLFRERDVAQKRFKLHVNTTNMDGGILKFAMARFTRASLRAADEGKREVHLDTSNAKEWGYLGALSAGPEPTESVATSSLPRDAVAESGEAAKTSGTGA